MKKIYSLSLLILLALQGLAQSFSVSGPRTYYSTKTSIGTGNTVYFNFDKGRPVASTDIWHVSLAATSGSATVAFNTGVEAQILADTSFAKATIAPTAGYTATISNAIYPTGSIFQYNSTSHIISVVPGKLIAVKLADGRYVKMEMISLYRYAPVRVQDSLYTKVTFGYYSFRYLVSESGSTDWSQKVTKIKNLLVPASSSPAGTYQYLNLAAADTADLSTDRWNFRIRTTSIEPNATAQAAQLVSTAFNDVTTASTITNAALSGWYTYEGVFTHTITANQGKTIVFKDSLGRYGKLVIESYYKNGGAVACSGSGYYTVQYYYNPYGVGETIAGRDGSDLNATATLVQSVSPTVSLDSYTLPVPTEGFTAAESVDVTSNHNWVASTTDSWITLANTTGNGDGSFSITATANTGAQRQGTVTLTYCNGAAKTLTVTQAASATSTKDAIASKIQVYPNPSSDRFNINMGSVPCEEISVINLQGKAVWNTTAPDANQEINTQEWNKGIYFLKISSQGEVFFKKIEIQ